ncbi:MAG TPA: hypothetical protein VMX58_05730 [Patescibacteria group bacterium]|nr:hypothetical protein [Patescibacteria group bacterium]
MKQTAALIIVLVGAFALGSCIFQNDPLKPNNPPIIEFSYPPERYLSRTAPDSLLFFIRAVDPDGDIIDYIFVIGDSVLGTSDSLMFFATDSGDYHLQGLAMDGNERAAHSWFITVDEDYNEPPFIIGYLPSQREVSCTVGETLAFSFSTFDPNNTLDELQFTYELKKIGEAQTSRFYGSAQFEYRFLERGEYDLKGIVWDGEYGDTTSWFVNVTGDPDTIAPAVIIDLEGRTGNDLGSVWITWTAVGDDGTTGSASAYEVRTSTEPILTEEDWEEASRKNNTPVPAPPGTQETMVVRALNPGTYVYLTMRAIDDFFNYSPLGNCIHLLVRGIDATGYVYAMHTGEPLGGFLVTSHERRDTTDLSGAYLLKDLPYYMSYIRATDDDAFGTVGEYYDCNRAVYDPDPLIHQDFYSMPALGIQSTYNVKVYENRFIVFFKEVTETDGRFGKSTVYHAWNHWPLKVHSPEKVFEGLDLQAVARGAMDEWEAETGYDLFVEVDQLSEADVRIVYIDDLDYKHRYRTVEWNPDGTPKLREIQIYTANTSVPLWRLAHLVYAHEMGHVLGFLAHSADPGHLMLGLTLPQVHHVTPDEANVIKILRNMPPIFDYGSVIDE